MITMEKPNYGSFINYAHRGASEYMPENTLLSFYTGVSMGANGIETDVRRTKDGTLVLFHDADLSRVCGEKGGVCDYDLKELKEFFVFKNSFKDKIVTLEDFLQRFSFMDLTFAVELKVAGVGKETIELLKKYGAAEKTVITSFEFDYLKETAGAEKIKIGWLLETVNEEKLALLKSIGGTEICPNAEILTKEKIKTWHDAGFTVRAWGVSDQALMLNVLETGVNGMTVNFPDKLTEKFLR